VDTQAIADQAKAELAQTITEGLMSMVGGDSGALTRILSSARPPASTAQIEKTAEPVVEKKPETKQQDKKETVEKKPATSEKTASNDKVVHEPVWIETPDCTTCDECVDIAPAMFKYDDDKKAIVIDPTAGTFEQIVRSAEKCTAVIIHPGTPWNPDEPNLEKLIKRAEKFQ
jgi:pyruvate-ferredoxin/flavodoxin oxidoreductase